MKKTKVMICNSNGERKFYYLTDEELVVLCAQLAEFGFDIKSLI